MRLIWNASPTRSLQENYYITAENAGADLMGELAKTRKCRSIGYRMAYVNRTGKCGSLSRGLASNNNSNT